MIITLKTLQQVTLKIDIDASKTVKDLKTQIEEAHGKDYNAAHQKLIYSGKILADDKPLSEYNIEEKKFVVLMITRTPPPPKPAAEPPQEASSKDAGSVKKESQSKESDKSSSAAGSSSSSSVDTSLSSAESNLVTGDAYRDIIKRICDMGYTKKQVERALRASYNNPDRAVEYLVSGFPPEIESRMREAAAAQTATRRREPDDANAAPESRSPNDSRSPVSRLAGISPHERWELIRNQPQFRNMQQIVHENPHLLSHAIEALADTNPELYNLVSENPDAFLAALQQPLSRSGTDAPQSQPQPPPPSQQAPQQQQQQRAPGQPGNEGSRVDEFIGGATQQDKDAIERLKSMGFPEYLVVQAYVACNRDEQKAANLLLQMD